MNKVKTLKIISVILSSLISTTFVLSAEALVSGRDLLNEKAVEIKPGQKGTVVVFMSAKCPCSNSHVSIIKQLASEFKNFSFVVIHSNRDENIEASKSYFQKAELTFPVIQDDNAKLANELKAFKTPHAFVLDPQGNILYKGGVTNSVVGQTASKQFLREALMNIDTGKPPKNPEGRTLGCMISR